VVFWTGMVVGAAIVGVALYGIADNMRETKPQSLVRFVLGAGIAHDFLVAPLVVLVGWLTYEVVPRAARPAVRVGLALTFLTVLIAWPVVRAYGRSPRNPSLLPLDYGQNLVVALVVIWVATAVAATMATWRSRR